MTEPFASESDDTRTEGADPATGDTAGVRGGSADRMDPPGEGAGGVPGAGADGETAAREQLRKDLGERAESAGTEAP